MNSLENNAPTIIFKSSHHSQGEHPDSEFMEFAVAFRKRNGLVDVDSLTKDSRSRHDKATNKAILTKIVESDSDRRQAYSPDLLTMIYRGGQT